MNKELLAVAIAAIVVGAGCIGQVTPTGEVTNPPGEQPGTTEPEPTEEPDTGLYEPPEGIPSITLLEPAEGAVLEDTTAVRIRVSVENFRVVGPKSANRDNEGHIYAYLLKNGVMYKEQRQAVNVFSFAGVAPGDYTVVVELSNNDKTPLVPVVKDTATITLK